MTDKTRELILASIRHHQELLNDPVKGEWGVGGCPLCLEFRKYDEFGNDCVGCPIKERTGKHHCDGTPYHDAESLAYELSEAEKDERSDEFIEALRAKFEAAELNEIDFLHSLLPESADSVKP